MSLHKDLFDFCTSAEINLEKVDRLTVVDINRWDRLDRLDRLKENRQFEIFLFDHHGIGGDTKASWQCREEVGANITLMIRYLKAKKISIGEVGADVEAIMNAS